MVAPEFGSGFGWNTPDHYTDIWLIDVNGDGAADICGRGSSGILCEISGAKAAHQVQFTAQLWVNNFGDNNNWNSSPSYWQTVQPMSMLGGAGGVGFCGRGIAGIWCSFEFFAAPL